MERPNRALRLHAARDVRLADEATPGARDGELLLRITAVGLCGSDRHQYLEGGIGGASLVRPLVLGHEVVGTVEEGASPGSRVAIDPAVPCEICPTCLAGSPHLCPNMDFAGLETTDGGLQRYLAWPAVRCVPVPDGLTDTDASLLEVLGIALHALDLADVQPGMRVGVFGAGPVGLVLIRALRVAGADVVMATDVLPHRVEAARAAGVEQARLVDPGARAAPPGLGAVDVAFECAGDEAALDTAIDAVDYGGRVLLVGIPEGPTARYGASPARRKELSLQWVRRMAEGDLERAAGLVSEGRIALDGIVSDVYGLEEGPAAFAALAARTGLKVVVQPSQSRMEEATSLTGPSLATTRSSRPSPTPPASHSVAT